ncbi:hypothetical protein ACFRAR_15760 [Kitasatospora sp. NPDC056651]|uniref:hypothetical protein n=1 Tax=Kitasatospora sp. NPDC056651 TaxID=3345892 RepID=UPI0036C1C738
MPTNPAANPNPDPDPDSDHSDWITTQTTRQTLTLRAPDGSRSYDLSYESPTPGRGHLSITGCDESGEIVTDLQGDILLADTALITQLLQSLTTATTTAAATVPTPRTPEPEKAYTVEEKRRLHPNAYKRWTPEEDTELTARCAQGASLSELSTEFGRNEGAIASRILKIDARGPATKEAQEYGG